MLPERDVCQCESPVPGYPNYWQSWTITDTDLICNICKRPANREGWQGLMECIASIPACGRIYAGLDPEESH